ncbi:MULTISPECIES: hypothetical protein [unclassified Corynebacterium]|uniref:hypothetical protein n=1 Tax=unclassified Corynebacterium TaxID=2624378 RepID=UPI0029CA942B|nr:MULTISPECIES: hypothetical protein [unclassified Corynebacterium]WPF65522.1 hypothetical protein OLX12_08025 [Corynebacterium sp. 22KM0430]WPF68017.1 hypothetical protein OLW90_08020 [Corynebacterium sp. 21KM1197]
MFGYTPEYIDEELDYMRQGPITRTKQRTYIIAVWSGWGGGHNYFLGQHVRGLARSVLLMLTLDAAFRLQSVWLTLLYLAVIVVLAFLSIFFVAKSDPDSHPYHTKTDPFFYAWVALFIWNVLWGWNYWKVPTKPRPKEIDESNGE